MKIYPLDLSWADREVNEVNRLKHEVERMVEEMRSQIKVPREVIIGRGDSYFDDVRDINADKLGLKGWYQEYIMDHHVFQNKVPDMFYTGGIGLPGLADPNLVFVFNVLL